MKFELNIYRRNQHGIQIFRFPKSTKMTTDMGGRDSYKIECESHGY